MITKTTFYLDTKLYKTLKLRAVETGRSASNLINDALQAQLAEDLEDITAIRSRLAQKEIPLSYEATLKELQKRDKI